MLQQLREVAAASKDGPLQAPLCSLWPYCLLALAMLTMATLTMATLGMACLELLQVPPQLVGAFTVQHYAQRVRYQVAGFVEKNRDALPDEVRRLMRSSGFGLAAALFKESVPAATDGGSAGGSELGS